MFNDSKYLELEKKVNDFKGKYSKMKESKMYDAMYLMKMVNEFNESLKEDLNNYYDDRTNELREQQEKIKAEYAKGEVDNPTTELLNRQEWELDLKLATKEELEEKVKHFVDSGEGSKVYLNMLRLVLKENGMSEAESKVKAYIKGHNIDTPYMNDERFIKTVSDIMAINQVRNSGYLHIGEGDNRRLVSLAV